MARTMQRIEGRDRMFPGLPIAAGWTLAFGLALAALVASAQVMVPMVPVPMTMQTLVVLLIGVLGGPELGMATATAYMALGIAGVPVFHGWLAAPGPLFLVLPTAGFIVGFIPAAGLAGWLVRRFGRGWLTLVAAMLLGHAVLFATGVAWLAALIGLPAAIAGGFLPFLAGTALKVGLGTLVGRVASPRSRTV